MVLASYSLHAEKELVATCNQFYAYLMSVVKTCLYVYMYTLLILCKIVVSYHAPVVVSHTRYLHVYIHTNSIYVEKMRYML